MKTNVTTSNNANLVEFSHTSKGQPVTSFIDKRVPKKVINTLKQLPNSIQKITFLRENWEGLKLQKYHKDCTKTNVAKILGCKPQTIDRYWDGEEKLHGAKKEALERKKAEQKAHENSILDDKNKIANVLGVDAEKIDYTPKKEVKKEGTIKKTRYNFETSKSVPTPEKETVNVVATFKPTNEQQPKKVVSYSILDLPELTQNLVRLKSTITNLSLSLKDKQEQLQELQESIKTDADYLEELQNELLQTSESVKSLI